MIRSHNPHIKRKHIIEAIGYVLQLADVPPPTTFTLLGARYYRDDNNAFCVELSFLWEAHEITKAHALPKKWAYETDKYRGARVLKHLALETAFFDGVVK